MIHDSADRYRPLLDAVRELDKAHRRSVKAADARHDLPPGSSRARVTTANARWARAAEARDERRRIVLSEMSKLGMVI